MVTRSMKTTRRLQSFAGPVVATSDVKPAGRNAASAAFGTLKSNWNLTSLLYSIAFWARAAVAVPIIIAAVARASVAGFVRAVSMSSVLHPRLSATESAPGSYRDRTHETGLSREAWTLFGGRGLFQL